MVDYGEDLDDDKIDMWLKMQNEARTDIEEELIVTSFYSSFILSQNSLGSAPANHLSMKLSNNHIGSRNHQIRILACQAHRVVHKCVSLIDLE
ncbi:hypothetical protein G4B88_019978 [Cannabis sativa]|nr:hypothetical protein G4B88_019978 [Cannabis sativa]